METESRKTSMKDVAQRAGVSTATVSHVFSGKKRVNDEVAQKVRRAAEELGYVVDRVASQMRTGRTQIVAIMVPDLEDLFLNRFVACLEAYAGGAGYEVIVASSHDDPRTEHSRLKALLAWRPAGLIVVPCGDSVPAELVEERTRTPIICADRVEPGSAPFDTVTVDNFGAGRMIARFLLAKGVKSILFVTATLGLYTISERVRGAREELGVDASTDIHVLEIGSDPISGAQRLSAWLRTNGPPDAIVGLTNMMTLAALSALAEQQLEAPTDILLMGFHDSPWMTARRVPVTTLSQPVDEVARCVWERLEKRMGGDDSALQNIILSTQLIERASTSRTEHTRRDVKVARP